jgi:heptaprenyl diphosphate synthase
MAEALDAGLAQVEQGLRRELSFTNEVADSVARYLFDAGGKRVRPLLALLTSQWGEGINEKTIIAGQVVELTHLATLYHDDVMDEAVKRRGVTAAHKVWSNSVAIIAGDLLFARAGSLGVELGDEAMRRQTETFERLVLGQMRETVGPGEDENPVDHYLSVLEDKTGSLIALAGELGLAQSGGPEQYVPAIRGFGEQIGIAFQLVDDVLDLSADEKQTGKRAGTDLRRGVPTLPLLLLEQEAATDRESEELLQQLKMGQEGQLDDSEFSKAIRDLNSHEVTERTMDHARQIADSAIAHLAGLPEDLISMALGRFADQVVKRKN